MPAECAVETTLPLNAENLNSNSLGTTPVNRHKLEEYLKHYSQRDFLIQGFTDGFHIQYTGPRHFRDSKNLTSIIQNPHIAQQKIRKELEMQRIGGPFDTPPFTNMQISPLGLVPKNGGDFRLIHHLSYPENQSINHYIPQSECSVHYSCIDDAAAIVAVLGQGTLLAKSDIKSAFRLVPVNPTDFELLGFRFQNKYFFDKMLPFGASISCAIWEKFATALHWITQNQSRNPNLLHYLDDFLFAGPPKSKVCIDTLSVFKSVCSDIGVPIAEEKTTAPSTNIIFLGIEFDTQLMVMRLPKEKLIKIKSTIQSFCASKKVTLRSLQSLIGLLNFACRVIAPGRAFCRRLIDATSGVKKPHHKVRVNMEMKADLQVWLSFLEDYNGVTVISNNCWVADTNLQLFTDSAGGPLGGFGIYFAGSWAHSRWPLAWTRSHIIRDMTFLELFPVYVALCLWPKSLADKRILFHIDNMAVVHIINNSTSKSKHVMQLVRKIVFITLKYNITVKAQYIPTKLNKIADCISRSQWTKFHHLAPAADRKPMPLPSHIWRI